MDAFPDMGKHIEAEKRRLVLYPSAPLESARIYLQLKHDSAQGRTLHHQNDTFYTWARTHYLEMTKEEVLSKLYNFLETADQPTKEEGVTAPFNPNKNKVANVKEALAAAAQLPSTVRPPAWLGDATHPPARDLVSCTNGLLHLPTRKLLVHSPAFFTLNALDFSYDENATEPAEWLKFLKELWPSDKQSIEMLQEMFGLALTGDTSYQKAFLLVGPKRCGKGTIARVLTKILGQVNVCGPTLSGMSQNFGLESLIAKRLALISDARLGGKPDQQVVVERILAITGEDSLSVPRKNKEDWIGQLETRIMVLTNELPKLADASGALASRFLILLFTESFYGREDRGLTGRLSQELAGILNWSLDGWDRLKKRGYFVQPAAAAAAQRDFEDLGSPIGAFIRDCCKIGPVKECRPDELYSAWVRWCDNQNITHVGTVQTFGRDLRSVVPSLKTDQQRNNGIRERVYKGIDFVK